MDNAHCNRCGYDLTGLSRDGRCPECGQSYDVDSHRGTYNRNDPLQRSDHIIRRVRLIALFSATAMVMVGSGVASMRMTNPKIPLIIGGLIVLVLVPCTVLSYLSGREKDDQ